MAESDKINKNDLISQEALDSIEQLKALLNAAQKELLDLINAGKGLDESIKNATKISKLTTSIKSLSASIEKLYAAQAKLDAAQGKLTGSINSNTSATTKNTTETNKNTSAKNSNTNSSSKLGSSTKELYYSIKNLYTAYLGLSTIMTIFNKIVGDTKAMDSVIFTLKTIITDSNEFAQTQEYLKRIQEAYGLSLVESTNAYVRFRAAVGQSNMTIKEGQNIFESIAKASAVMGMSVEKTNDVFLALEQMLSKGSIMSEELRRQMGQHLPVAMAAMAAAAKDAGISTSGTTAELLKLMKQAKVTAEDVLPYFAKEVEKALGIENVDRVDTLIAAQNRLTLAWMEFVKALNISEDLKKAYNDLATFTRSAAELMTPDKSKVTARATNLVSGVVENISKATTPDERRALLMEQMNLLLEKQSKLTNRIVKDSKELPGTFQKIGENIWRVLFGHGFGSATTTGIDFEAIYNDTILDEKAYKEAIELIRKDFENFAKMPIVKPKITILDDEDKKFTERLAIFKAQLNARFAAFKESQESMRLQAHNNVVESGADELNIKRADAALEMDMEKNLFDFRNKQMDDLLKYTKSNAKAKADTEKEVAELSASYASKVTDFKISEDKRETDKYQRELERRKDLDIAAVEETISSKLLALQQAAADKSKGIKTERGFELIDSQLQIDSLKITEEGLQHLLDVDNLTTNEMANIAQKLADTKKAIADAERAQVEKDFKRKKELTQQAFEYGKQTMEATFGMFTAFQDANIQRLEWQHEREVNLAGDNVAKKIAAENKYDIEKRKLMRRQAILQKAQGAANVIINTAQAIMATLAETGIFGLPLTPIIAGIGALQLAAVLAQPIPAYEFGGKHDGGIARMSEKGEELFIPDNGVPMLTPKNETIANMPSGTFVPHDETQRILAEGAMNNFVKESNDIDMFETNSILRTISNKKETFYSKGFKITNKSNIFGRYVTRN